MEGGSNLHCSAFYGTQEFSLGLSFAGQRICTPITWLGINKEKTNASFVSFRNRVKHSEAFLSYLQIE